MKLVLLTPRFPPDSGGVAEATSRIAHLLAATGECDIHMLAVRSGLSSDFPHPHPLAPYLWLYNLPPEPVPRTLSLQPNLIHAFYPSLTGAWALYLQQTWQCPLAVAFRGNDLDRDIWRQESRERLLAVLAQASGGTAVSRDLAHKAQALAPHMPMAFIPNSADISRLQPSQNRPDLHLQPGVPIIGFSGEARQKKGLPVLLQAWKRVQPAYLILLGGVRVGADTELLQVFMAQNPSLEAFFKMIPYQPQAQLADWYTLFDVVVCPSYQDGCPNSVLDAMACKRPVIGSRVGGIPDLLTHGKDGWLIAPRSVDELANALQTLLADSHLRKRLGQAAYEKVTAYFRSVDEVTAFQQFYHKLVFGDQSWSSQVRPTDFESQNRPSEPRLLE